MSAPRAIAPPSPRGRRRTLEVLGLGLCSSLAGACAPAGPPDRRVRVPLSELPLGVRVRVQYDEAPVELLRFESAIEARSLLCTHFGCRLRWSEDDERYLCSCHGGAFDAAGAPVAGPPTRPLRRVGFELVGDVLVLGER